jgi:hypothetical protein
MHHHIWCPIQKILVPIEHITHVSILGFNVPIVQIYMTQLHSNNKITYKALSGLGEFYQLIQPHKQRHDTREPKHYLQITKQLQNVGNLINNANILMHLQNQGPIFKYNFFSCE